MQKSPWTEDATPSINGVILREDGRQCRVKEYQYVMAHHPGYHSGATRMGALGAAELPPTSVGSRHLLRPIVTFCGDAIPPKIISLNIYWPTSIYDGKVTCETCLAKSPK